MNDRGLNAKMPADHVIWVDVNGEVHEAPGIHGPESIEIGTADDDARSVLKEHEDEYERQVEAQGWTLLRGWSGAYLAGGTFMMHPSEFIGGGLEKHILENPGYYVAFSVEDGSERGTEHWAVAFKERPAREQCAPSDADWSVNLVYGMTFCPETAAGEACTDRDDPEHDRQYGTETNYNYGHFKGDRPDADDVASLLPEGFYEIERTIKRCPNPGDESTCRWCSDDIEFAVDGDTRWGRTNGEDGATFCGASPEDDRHEPDDEYNEEKS